MKNEIIYGKPGCGKTTYLCEMANNFKGRVLLVAAEDLRSLTEEKFKHLSPDQIHFDDALDHLFNVVSLKCDQYYIDKFFMDLIQFINNKESNDMPILIGIDNIDHIDLSHIMSNGNSILWNLVDATYGVNVQVVLVTQDVSILKRNFKAEYKYILSDCKQVSPNTSYNFSGELRLRFPVDLHKELYEQSNLQGVSLNSFINFILTKEVFNHSYQMDQDLYKVIDKHDLPVSEILRLIDRFTSINKDHGLSVDLFFDRYVKEPKKAYSDEV